MATLTLPEINYFKVIRPRFSASCTPTSCCGTPRYPN